MPLENSPLRGTRCLRIAAIGILALAGFLVATTQAQAKDAPKMVDVIVQADGDPAGVGRWVEGAGGRVRYRYQNVPALAVSLPSSQVAALTALASVRLVEKERMFYLNDTGPEGTGANERSRAYVVAASPGHQVHAFNAAALKGTATAKGYANFLYTGAAEIWEATGFGEGTIVAVVDSGVVRNVALADAVTGAPGFPNGYNAYPDGVEATDPGNHWHGTFVAGVVAGSAALQLEDPADPLYQAIATFLPVWQPASPTDPMVVPILGQAPLAKVYPVKVFPQSEDGSPTSIILDGLDHVLSLKKKGLLDVDIVNLSLGGPTVFDGLNTFDRFLDELTRAKILVVAAAGNEGPIPNSVGSPATSFSVLSVGALDFAPSSRVFYEWLGRAVADQAGMGWVMRPTAETRVANFSSRGPLSDGRVGPEISALGLWNFGVDPGNGLMWAGGTSFASPTVAGAAALLNAFWEAQGNETAPGVLQSALLRSAKSDVVGRKWRDVNDQGQGAVDAPAALEALQRRRWSWEPDKKFGRPLEANILGEPIRGRTQQWDSRVLSLDPSETFDAVLEIGKTTSRVTVEVYDIQTPDNSDRAFWPNSLEVHVQSAKRTAAPHPVAVFWYPFLYGNAFTLQIDDGAWTLAGETVADQPMEPGLMKISLAGDSSNESPVRFKMRIKRENQLSDRRKPIAQGVVRQGDNALIPIVIPAGKTRATFDLRWERDWTTLPSSDIDMYLLNANGDLLSVDGATLNSPERVVLESPTPGTYYLFIDALEVYQRDAYKLYLRLE